MNYKQMLDKLQELEKRIQVLEFEAKKAELDRRVQYPYGPPIVPQMPNVCSKCGLKLDSVMGYVCSTPQCPTGLGGAWC